MSDSLFGIQLNSDKNLILREVITQRILEIRLQSPIAEVNKRPNLNLAIVLDRSGSMQGEKLAYVKQAAHHVLDQLTEQDQVTLVVYDDHIQVLAPSMRVTHGNRFELKRLISSIQAGNMTNLADGWLTGCREIASAAREGTINRALLLTDGLANVGITDLEILSKHALELYKDSISTSTFGVGEGFNEYLLEAMANRGGGNFYYISTPERIPEIFLKEFNDLVGIAARKVEIRLELPASVEWQVLGGWSAEYKDGHLHIYVGDMLTGKLQDIYIRLQIPADGKSTERVVNARAFGKDNSNNLLESQASVAYQYAAQEDFDAAPQDRDLMERFSIVELADTATEALKLEREGEREAADRLLQANISRSRPYIGHPAAANYQSMSDRIRAGMTEADRKSSHWDSYNIKRQKREKDQEEEK